MKKEGFIFSVDALGAIVVVTVLGIAWVLYVHTETGISMTQKHKRAQDTTLVNLYTKNAEFQDLNIEKEVTTCKKYFFYDTAYDETGDPIAQPASSHCEEELS